MSFVELYLKGSVLEKEIDRFVEDWHEGRGGRDMELHDYLGMTWEEYQLWAKTPSALPLILIARKHGKS